VRTKSRAATGGKTHTFNRVKRDLRINVKWRTGTSIHFRAYRQRDLALSIHDVCNDRRTEGPSFDDLDVGKFEWLRFLQMVYLDV